MYYSNSHKSKCSNLSCGCKTDYLTTPDPCPTPDACPDEQPCSEVFDSQCLIYNGASIICGPDTVVETGDTVQDALAQITAYFCAGSAPDVPSDITCGVDTVVPAGTSVVDALPLIVTYFCDEVTDINNQLINGSTVNFVDTLDLNGCTIRSFTIELLSGATVIETINFATPAICPRHIIEDEGTPLTERDTINFTGTGITATDTGTEIEVNVPGPTTYGLFAQTANSTPVANTTTPGTLIGTGVGSLTVPANTFQIGDSFRGEMFGNILARNNDSVTIRVKFNAVTVLTLGPILMPSVTSKKFLIETYFTIRTIGVGGTVLTGIKYQHESDAADKFNGHATTDEIVIDTTISNTLDIELEWSAADILNSITSQTFTLTKTY